MHLLLVRHGQSTNNIIEAAHGAGEFFDQNRSINPALSSLGQRQAALLGRHLGAQLQLSRSRVHLYCSSMLRAMQTLMPLAAALDLPLRVRPEFHEVGGFYDTAGNVVRGPSHAELQRVCLNSDVCAMPEQGQGAETSAEALARADAVVQLLRSWAMEDDGEERIVVVVSHNDFIGLLARRLLVPSGIQVQATNNEGMFTESYWPMNNTGISHFVIGVRPPPGSYPANTWLVYWNRSDHLSEDIRAGVQFRNVGFCGAGAWARVGEGGSGLVPRFVEHATFRARRRSWEVPLLLAACVSSAALGAILARR